MTKTDEHLLRAALQKAFKDKNFDEIVKNRNLLLNDRLAGPDLTHYLALTKKKYDALVLSESEPHIRLAQRALRAVSEWLQKDGLKEFEDEFFNEEKLNKAIECYHDDNSILETTEEEVEDEASRDTMTIRRAVREWAKIERELEFLQRPHFVGLEAVVRLRAEHAALAPAMRERNEFAEVRKVIVSRGAARRFSRVRAAFSCSDAASVLRHYAGLREDAEYLRAQYPANPAALMFADRTEGLAALVEEKKGDLEKQREADKAAVLSGVKQTTREVKETQVKENLAWKQTKGEADGLNERHKQLKGNENE